VIHRAPGAFSPSGSLCPWLPLAASPFSTEAAAAGAAAGAAPAAKRIVVLGGNGFVGSAVCQEALSRGLEVVSINRSGPPPINAPWLDQVTWVQDDVFHIDGWREYLQDTAAVVSCIGAFGGDAFMRRINGTANVEAVKAAKEEGVERFVFISAHDYQLPGFVIPGYFAGKREVEAALADHFPTGGVALRLGPIHGTRVLPWGQKIPLGAIFGPLEALMNTAAGKKASEGLPVLGPLLAPPLSDSTVARAAVAAATDTAVPAGVMGVWEVAKFK